ncbi:unnamed protein product [Prunus armeniaca]|uniref:RNase H type-1 domain-containing protein n=1 Tax=Prunus armeniaca TaxID=36596 RepID=A0A6J5XI46_PRUAR|nr:unnamed protein product [Prunus armeniaca]
MAIGAPSLQSVLATELYALKVALEGVLVTEIRRLLLALSFCVRFVPRTTNTMAHCIARYSLRAEELCYWLGDRPSRLLDDVREDGSHFV